MNIFAPLHWATNLFWMGIIMNWLVKNSGFESFTFAVWRYDNNKESVNLFFLEYIVFFEWGRMGSRIPPKSQKEAAWMALNVAFAPYEFISSFCEPWSSVARFWDPLCLFTRRRGVERCTTYPYLICSIEVISASLCWKRKIQMWIHESTTTREEKRIKAYRC